MHKIVGPYGLKVFLLIIGSICSFALNAQQWSFEFWHEGKVILAEGDTLHGQIKYDIFQDIIQYTSKDKAIEAAYSARKVMSYEIFDNEVHRYRRFFTLPYTQAGSYRAPTFFELLTDGKLTLLSRESLEYRNVNAGYYGGSYQRQVLVNHYFFLNENGEITAFTGDKRDLLDMMGKHREDVEKFMKANKLQIEEKYEFIRIVSYYNAFFAD
jgi:hypothetical protein